MVPTGNNSRKKVEDWIEQSQVYRNVQTVSQGSHPPAITTDLTSYLGDFGGILKSAFDWTLHSVDDVRGDSSSEQLSAEDKPSPVASKPHLRNGNIAIFEPTKPHKLSKSNSLTSVSRK
ncbi:hypothetical protein GUITHDRAFT_152830 [Guillardia theta CCMP2712]|uniref:Uncharacterized protein n=1 Tax=Guillardia theta (strain CCMP2712) TaxID=905079 RepID=L1JAB4_GUITC|nr:hypothetical protein GUITHDRAFT_152830 [Guillardia theta CCMP2712]EKX45039.1 hypothetical protein GUITHDRAFT_152830 [Guillardia theta CCMP2712]|mmetsp:Transcript_8366/g.28104  ORF Transcript_8366/g.28104 Transcript_8366/m.28104 type:complete len:119 (-) Transcript_8366:419-775(-)|eukprot:XP_005832019.1 hypothetical protein GUITHDRAFT_152830 [Guillardia theta CCMP2712]